MFFINILRFFTGYVTFRAYGGFSERFINLCNASGIPLWDINADADDFFAATTIDGYKKIIPCARKSGMRTKLVKRSGLPFLMFRFRYRWGLLAGAIFFVLTLSILSGRIWLIDVSGNETVPDESIIEAVNDAGITIGSRRSSFNAAQCAITAESNFQEISRIAINIKGSRAQITVKENVGQPEITDNSGTYNVVSSADAQLVVLEPYSGTSEVKIFNSVLKGQTLISGINQNKDESASYVHAHGYAVGRTEKVLSSHAENNEQAFNIRKIKRVYSVFFLGKRIQLGRPASDYDFSFDNETYLSYKNKKMPVGIFYTEYSKMEKSNASLTSEDTKLICLERFMRSAQNYTASRQLISLEESEKKGKTDFTVTGKFACYENIGMEQPFEVSESYESESSQPTDG